MKVSFHPTFDQFADNYLSTYYSGGVQTLQRAIGGPVVIVVGAIIMVLANASISFLPARYALYLLGIAAVIFGLRYTVGPLFNLFLVWVRRDELYGKGGKLTTLELKDSNLLVTQGDETVEFPLGKILSVQHRSTNTWVLTQGDNLIYIPREGLASGDHDKFVQELENKLAPPAEA
jgi:hypothetical protein